MTSAATTTAGTRGRAGRAGGARRYWRWALAVAAPLPWAAMGVVNVVQPFGGDEDFATTVRLVRGHLDLVLVASWLELVFFALLVPSALAVVAATRRRAPRLAAWSGTLTVIGFGLGFSGVGGGGTRLAVVTVTEGFDVATMTRLDQAYAALPQVPVAGLFWLVALILGQALLGLALWRSHLVPALFPAALLLGGPTHPFLPGGHVAVGVGLLVAAVGYAGAGLALLRTADDEFDLAPLPPARR